MAEVTSRLRVAGRSLNKARPNSRPMAAKVLPLKRRKGAYRWQRFRKSKVSPRVTTRWRWASHSAAHVDEVSELRPCCAPPLSHVPRLMRTTDCQSQFLTKAARVCSGEPSPPPPPECPLRSGAPADPVS